MEAFVPVLYEQHFDAALLSFLEQCLPESGRALELAGRHSFYLAIPQYFRAFWCMSDGETIIGTSAVKELNPEDCELKSLYLLEKYHYRGLGRALLQTAIDYAKKAGYQKMYLDSLSTSTDALVLYRKMGFRDTASYNNNPHADVFMVLELSGEGN